MNVPACSTPRPHTRPAPRSPPHPFIFRNQISFKLKTSPRFVIMSGSSKCVNAKSGKLCWPSRPVCGGACSDRGKTQETRRNYAAACRYCSPYSQVSWGGHTAQHCTDPLSSGETRDVTSEIWDIHCSWVANVHCSVEHQKFLGF